MNRISTEEKRRHGSLLRPYACYAFQIPEDFPHVQLHWHGEFELTYVREGGSEFISGDEHNQISAGDVVLTQPNVLHAICLEPGQHQRYDTLVFSPELLGASGQDRCAAEIVAPLTDGRSRLRGWITPAHPAYGEIRRAVEAIFDSARADTSTQDLRLRSELLRLLWLLEANGSILRAGERADRSDAMRPVLSYIAENFRDPITIDQLAGLVHLSRSCFTARFRQAAGMSAVEYITHQRIRYARERLASTDDPAAWIAFDSGFRNLSNFNRQFRRIVGCTPLAYRRMNRM